jgi:hypothetical protein
MRDERSIIVVINPKRLVPSNLHEKIAIGVPVVRGNTFGELITIDDSPATIS